MPIPRYTFNPAEANNNSDWIAVEYPISNADPDAPVGYQDENNWAIETATWSNPPASASDTMRELAERLYIESMQRRRRQYRIRPLREDGSTGEYRFGSGHSSYRVIDDSREPVTIEGEFDHLSEDSFEVNESRYE